MWFQLLIRFALEIRLTNLGPVFAGIRAGVGVFPEPLVDGVLIGLPEPGAPGVVHPGERGVDGVAELVEADALVVVAVAGQVEQVFLAEAGHVQAAGPSDPLVEIVGVGAVAIFGHVGIDLILADDDQAGAKPGHRLQDVGPVGEQMSDDVVWSASGPHHRRRPRR